MDAIDTDKVQKSIFGPLKLLLAFKVHTYEKNPGLKDPFVNMSLVSG